MACLGFTYGCFAGLPMAWPFGTIVGSNCGCDRHPVSSLDPLSIQRTRLSDTHSFKIDGFSRGFCWPSWARWDGCTWMGLWPASAMAAKTVTIAACRCIGWTGERFGIGVRGFWSDGLGFKLFQSSNNPAAWSASCRLTLRRPRYCLEAQRGAQAGGFCICEVRPGKIHEAPSAAIYSGRVLEPRESCCTCHKDDTGSGWSCLWVGMSNSRQFSVTVDKPDRTLRSRPKQDAGNPEFANDSIPFPCLLRRMVHPFAGPR